MSLILFFFFYIYSYGLLLPEHLRALFRDPVICVLVLVLIGLWWGFY